MKRPVNNPRKAQRLQQALETMALVIDRYGDTYWPIFEALENLLQQEEAKHDALARYRSTISNRTRPAGWQSLAAQQSSNVTSIRQKLL